MKRIEEKNLQEIKQAYSLLMQNENIHKQGQIVDAIIKEVGDEFVRISIKNLKADAMVNISEFSLNGVQQPLFCGQETKVLLRRLDKGGRPSVSRLAVNYIESENRIKEAEGTDKKIEGIAFMMSRNGGAFVDCNGVIGYINSANFGPRDKDISSSAAIMNRVCDFYVTGYDSKNGLWYLSRKGIVDEEVIKLEENFFNVYKVGDIVNGVVENIVGSLAFISLESSPISAVLHHLDIAWKTGGKEQQTQNTIDTIKIGQHIKVMIMKMEKETKKVSVSMKHTQENPDKELIAKYHIGDIVEGKISHLGDHGAVITLDNGFESFLHISECGWGAKESNAKYKELKLKDSLSVKIITKDEDKCKIGCSIKALSEDPNKILAKNYTIGDIIKVVVTRTTPFGIFVAIASRDNKDYDFLIHISELSFSFIDPQLINQTYQIGDEIDVMYLGYKEEEGRLQLSIKSMQPNPYEKYKEQLVVGKSVSCIVSDMRKEHVIVSMFNGDMKCSINKENLHKSNKVNIGDVLEAQVIGFDAEVPILSAKRLEDIQYDQEKIKGEKETGTSIAEILGIALQDRNDSKK